MMISTFEYKALFGNKNPNEISNEDIINKRKQIKYEDNSTEFHTWKEPSVIYNEWGDPSIGIIEKTGFEGEGF